VNAVSTSLVPESPHPRPLMVALVGVLVEAAALVAGGIAVALDVLAGRARPVGPALATTVFACALAGVLVLAGRALWRGRRWGRGPVITWQVLQAAVGLTQLGASPWLGGTLVALALVVIVGLLVPVSIEATSRSGTR
jgi:hypothetical protein